MEELNNNTPNWLMQIFLAENLPHKIPLNELLTDSLYYPASGLDTSPISLYGDQINSFVCCDYEIQEDEYIANGYFEKTIDNYKLIFNRKVEKEELLNPNWKPKMQFDEDPFGLERLKEMQLKCKPYAYWSIWENDNKNLISILHIAGEAVATYDGLYNFNEIIPKTIAIIQPGIGFGGSWTNLLDPNAIFYKTIRKGGLPPYLVIGYWGYGKKEIEDCPFYEYEFLRTKSMFRFDLKFVNKDLSYRPGVSINNLYKLREN